MQKELTQDTLDIMSEEDKKFYSLLKDLRFNMAKFIDMKIIVDTIIDCIDKSEIFSFTSKFARNVNINKPLFTIKYDEEWLERNMKGSNKLKFLENMVHEDIISPLSTKINKFIRKDPSLKEFLENNEVIKEIPKSINITSFLFASIFGINFIPNSNFIYLEYMK